MTQNKFVSLHLPNRTIQVLSDYYMEDGVRLPLSWDRAMEIANKNGWKLPTKEIVDLIWEQADLKLDPRPLPPSDQMASTAYIIRHNNMINAQIGDTRFRLVAGHKKDVIPQQRAGKVTIYGWHRKDGRPIQPVSSIHGHYYYDYSHGVRFIKD